MNGSGPYLTVPFNAGLSLGWYTVSTWVDINSQPAVNSNGGPALFSTRNGGDGTFDLQCYQPSAGVYALHADIGGTGGFINTAVNYTLPGALTGWNMITLEVNFSGPRTSSTAVRCQPQRLTIRALHEGRSDSVLGSQEAGGSSTGKAVLWMALWTSPISSAAI